MCFLSTTFPSAPAHPPPPPILFDQSLNMHYGYWKSLFAMALEKGQKIVKLKHSVNSSKSKLDKPFPEYQSLHGVQGEVDTVCEE